jgi:hypothetical protein
MLNYPYDPYCITSVGDVMVNERSSLSRSGEKEEETEEKNEMVKEAIREDARV